MIKERRRLPPLVTDRIPVIIEEVSKDPDLAALFSFGSLAKDALKPLSDLDFAVLVSKDLDHSARFEKHLNLIGLFNQVFNGCSWVKNVQQYEIIGQEVISG